MKIRIIPVSLLICTTLFTGCKEKNEKTSNTSILVNTVTATLRAGENTKEFSFISKPFRTSELSFRVGGPLDLFDVYPGSHYRRGEIIARIDARDFRIRKERAEAIYNQNKAEFERIKNLYAKNNISASSYEKAQADYTSAKTAYEITANELNDTRLIAPFDGHIGEVYIDNYQEVKATQQVVSFTDINRIKIEAYVTQEIALHADKLKKAILRFDNIPDKEYEASIIEISKSTTSNNLSYLLTASLPNKDKQLLSGMSGRVFLQIPTPTPHIVLPQAALCHRPSDGEYVWIINPDKSTAHKRKITISHLLPDGKAAIQSGLREKEIVAVSGLRFLSEGSIVTHNHTTL